MPLEATTHKIEPKPEPGPGLEPEPKPDPEPELDPKPKSDPKPKQEPQTKVLVDVALQLMIMIFKGKYFLSHVDGSMPGPINFIIPVFHHLHVIKSCASL